MSSVVYPSTSRSGQIQERVRERKIKPLSVNVNVVNKQPLKLTLFLFKSVVIVRIMSGGHSDKW